MARTKKDVVDYFPHDAGASQGDTLTVLQGRYGNDGYAFWFKLLEKLASTEGHFIDLNNPMKLQVFSAKMGITEITTVEILNLLVEMQAIDKELWDSRLIWCQNLVNNLVEVYKNRKRNLPRKPNTNHSNPITTVVKELLGVEIPQSKVEYSRVYKKKYIKEKDKYGEFSNVLLTSEEYDKLLTRFGEKKLTHLIEDLSLGIKSKGYKYKDHYATILAWERRDTKQGTKSLPDTKTLKEEWQK